MATPAEIPIAETGELPDALRRVADELGLPVALELAASLGGSRVVMSANPGPGNILVKALGKDTARAVAAVLGPGEVEVPMGPMATHARVHRRIDQMLEAGASHNQIARRVKVHVRTVERRAEKRRMHNQPLLFD